jgi:hypothetical protein
MRQQGFTLGVWVCEPKTDTREHTARFAERAGFGLVCALARGQAGCAHITATSGVCCVEKECSDYVKSVRARIKQADGRRGRERGEEQEACHYSSTQLLPRHSCALCRVSDSATPTPSTRRWGHSTHLASASDSRNRDSFCSCERRAKRRRCVQCTACEWACE